MSKSNLSRALFPGLDFCEPTTSEMTQAAHAWITLCAEGRDPLPTGDSWGHGCVTPSCAIVFGRGVAEHISEMFHWNHGQCTAHYFTVALCRVRAEVNILPRGVNHRGDALRIAQGILDRVANMREPDDASDGYCYEDDDVGAPRWEANDEDEDSGVSP